MFAIGWVVSLILFLGAILGFTDFAGTENLPKVIWQICLICGVAVGQATFLMQYILEKGE